MKVVLFDRDGQARLAEAPIPVPDKGEALIEVGACGICASDLHLAQIKSPGELSWPLVPGHEIAGVVVQTGPDVDRVQAGDHVAIHPVQTCGACPLCLRGNGNLCQRPRVIGMNRPGGFAEYVCAPVESLYPSLSLPDTVAAMTEPLACALHGFNRLAPRPGDSLLLFGAGSLGLLFLQLARNHGCQPIVAVDIDAHRMRLASHLGATHSLPADDSTHSRLKEIAPAGFDCVVDVTGVAAVVERLFQQVGWAGKLLMLGSCPLAATVEIHPRTIQRREVAVLGSFSFGDEFAPALQLLIDRKIDVATIMTHTYPLESFSDALAAASAGGAAVKVAFTPA
jgi:2-desacetyl-2-hydroxyethyl bacteriochlorophyllide A dehydrogenase